MPLHPFSAEPPPPDQLAEVLTPEDLRHFARTLVLLRAEQEGDLNSLATSLQDVRDARSDGTADDEHDPEGSTLSSDWSRISGLHGEASAKAAAVERALERISAGRYGACARCGEPISRARLEARPAAELCIDCARHVEPRR